MASANVSAIIPISIFTAILRRHYFKYRYTMKLHLGVIDVPYVDANGITTGDVAEIIEAKYGLLGDGFVPAHEDDIGRIMAESAAGAIEDLITGNDIGPFAEGCAKIATLMKHFVTTQEAERVGLPGVPTLAAIEGVNRRLKLKRGPRRPSFVDSSLMSSAYTAWVTDPLVPEKSQLDEIAAIQRDIA